MVYTRTMLRSLAVLVVTAALSWGGDTANRLPTKEEVSQRFKLRAIRTILEGLEYADFATQLNCPCYDVKISSDTGPVLIEIGKEGCPNERDNSHSNPSLTD